MLKYSDFHLYSPNGGTFNSMVLFRFKGSKDHLLISSYVASLPGMYRSSYIGAILFGALVPADLRLHGLTNGNETPRMIMDSESVALSRTIRNALISHTNWSLGGGQICLGMEHSF